MKNIISDPSDRVQTRTSRQQVEEVLPPSQEAGTQADEVQVEDLQLPSSSHHDLPRN